MTVYIFQSILKLKKECGCAYGLSLETPVRDVVNGLPTKRGSYSKKLRISGKCDVLLWDIDNDKIPIAAIEVKEDAWKYDSDIKRLAGLVQRKLEFGIFASCQFGEIEENNCEEAKGNLTQETECICEEIREYLRGLDRNLYLINDSGNIDVIQLDGDEQKLVWCPACFIIRNKENQEQIIHLAKLN